MRSSPLLVLYLVFGVLVAAGVIGDEPNLFSGLNTIKELVEVILTIVLWPLALLGVDFNIGSIAVGDGGSNGDGQSG
jgi:K+-transporting ATPase A subunit